MTHVGHGHSHDHVIAAVDRERRDRLAIATGANFVIAAIEVAAGIVIGSIALLADATHQAVDALALLVSMAAVVLAGRAPTPRRSFGWRRADVLGAQLSGLLLLATTVWIAYESILRLTDPPALDGAAVAVVAAITLVLNAACALFLRSHGEHSMAVRAAVLHLATDAASSAAVLVAGVLVAVTGADWLDPAVSLAISVVVALTTIRLLSATSHVLLEGAPIGIDPHSVEEALAELDGVQDVHHLHLVEPGARRAEPVGAPALRRRRVVARRAGDGHRRGGDARRTLRHPPHDDPGRVPRLRASRPHRLTRSAGVR